MQIDLPMRDSRRRSVRRINIAGALSVVAYLALEVFNPSPILDYSGEMIEASRTMAGAVTAIGIHLEAEGVEIDGETDPNRTGLIGPGLTGLMTSVGDLEAKRTTTNPDVSALLVHLLHQAGIAGGDTIAVGCSASFPALLVAVLSAAEAMEVHPVVIISLGASSHGATAVDFNLLDIYRVLLEKEILKARPAAVSLGGGRDVGEEYDPGLKERLIRQIESIGIPFIHQPDLRSNVAHRMGIYGMRSSGGRAVSAFVNVGGGYANMGTSQLALDLSPGINRRISMPVERERGVVHAMAAGGVPVIHLLHIRGLASAYGLPWDPVPLPAPGETVLIEPRWRKSFPFWSIAGLYLAVMILLMV